MEVLPALNVDLRSEKLRQQQHQEIDWQCYSPEEDCAADALASRLEAELRAAKRTHLSCGEVLLPCGLLQRVARDVLESADTEPCGIRGCTLYIGFESQQIAGRKQLGTVKCDPTTVSTFELYLTLRQSAAGWNSFLPQFIKNLTWGGTVMISPAYSLEKKKLYRSYVE